MKLELPKPKILARKIDEQIYSDILATGVSPIVARIIAARPLPLDKSFQHILSPSLSLLDNPMKMADMERAAERLACAIIQGERIGIETDHDCDGQTSHAVMHHNLVQHFRVPEHLLRSYIGHRINDGYGLSLSLVKKILADPERPSLILTADNGSGDEERIAMLKAAGIDVIVTDHHQIPSTGIPQSAYACLNPSRKDCAYNDPYIAGCMVAWLLMAATRIELIKVGYLNANVPKLYDSLDFVAVGTIADCVSMARSKNNRAVVAYGMKLIAAGVKVCWRVIKDSLNGPIDSETLSFRICPLLNSNGRVDDAFGSVRFLLAKDYHAAVAMLQVLEKQNNLRKDIQRVITQKGLLQALEQVRNGKYSLCIYLDDGHAGVHGVSATRIKESFGRPTVFLTDKIEPEILTGSMRGVDNFHVKQALQVIADNNPGLLLSFGGHAGAGGLSIRKNALILFAEQLEIVSKQLLNATDLGPVIFSDGCLTAKDIKPDILSILSTLEPFGREFELPVFHAIGKLLEIKYVGDGTHAKVIINIDDKVFSGIWFSAKQDPNETCMLLAGEKVLVAYTMILNYFRGTEKLELRIYNMQLCNS